MSGSLKTLNQHPERVLTAWVISLTIYLITAVWCSTVANPDELLVDKTIMISKSAFGPAVLLSVLCGTFLAACSSMVAAPFDACHGGSAGGAIRKMVGGG